MHVAYIHQHFSTTRGATGTRSYEMSQRLLRLGHQVTMICGAYEAGDQRADSQKRVTRFEIDGIRVLQVAEPYANSMGFARRVLAFNRFARTATRLVSSLDADIVFATSTPLTVGIPGMRGAKRLKVPFVFEVRDLWPELAIALGAIKNPLLMWYTRRLEGRIYRAADRIIALAPGIKEGICRTGYPPDRVALIPNSCDLDLFRPSERVVIDPRFGSPNEFRLVYTGAHGLANGLDAVLDAAVELRRRDARGIRFVFIGNGGLRNALMRRSRTEGLDSMVTWAPPIPKTDLARLLPQMDVGLMILKNVPAFYYGTSPNKFFDYIASGLPVLNNYPGWLAEIIERSDCGVVVPPDDPQSFADTVIRLRDSRDALKNMGHRARQLAEAKFSRDLLGNQFVGILESAYQEVAKCRSRKFIASVGDQ